MTLIYYVLCSIPKKEEVNKEKQEFKWEGVSYLNGVKSGGMGPLERQRKKKRTTTREKPKQQKIELYLKMEYLQFNDHFGETYTSGTREKEIN